jgi:hypothetical protein
VSTGGLRVSRKFMGLEEGTIVAVSRTSGPSLVCVFAAGASLSDATSLS